MKPQPLTYSLAGHLFSDLLASELTLLAAWLAQISAVGQATFGYQRLEILVALLNELGLVTTPAVNRS